MKLKKKITPVKLLPLFLRGQNENASFFLRLHCSIRRIFRTVARSDRSGTGATGALAATHSNPVYSRSQRCCKGIKAWFFPRQT